MRFKLITVILQVVLLILSGCQPSSTANLGKEELSDTTAPKVLSVTPEGDAVGFEVDELVRVSFDEEVFIDRHGDGKGIKLYSSRTGEDGETAYYERDAFVNLQSMTNESIVLDEATGETIQRDISVAYIRPESGRFALNNGYTVTIENTVTDLVEDNPETAEDERNFFDGPREVSFTTEIGEWSNLSHLYEAKNLAAPEIVSGTVSSPVHSSDSSENFFYARVVNGNELLLSKFSTVSNNWLNLLEEEVSFNCLASAIANGSSCVNTVTINALGTGLIEDVQMSSQNGLTLLTWLQEKDASSEKTLWSSVYRAGKWSDPFAVNTTFSNDSNIDVTKHSASINENGFAIITWRENNASTVTVKATTFYLEDSTSFSQNYGDPITLFSKSIDDELQVRKLDTVWLNASNGLILWTEFSEGAYRIFEKPIIVDNFEETIEETVNIEIDAESGEETRTTTEYSVYDFDFAWGAAARIDSYPGINPNQDGNVVDYRFTVSSQGDLSLVWKKFDGRLDSLWFSNRVTGLWSTAQTVENNQLGSVIKFDVSYDAFDRLNIAWSQLNEDSETDIFARAIHPLIQINNVVEIKTTSNSASDLIMRFDFEGNGHLIWIEDSGTTRSVHTSFYSKLTDEWSTPDVLYTGLSFALLDSLTATPLKQDGRLKMLFVETNFTEHAVKHFIYD